MLLTLISLLVLDIAVTLQRGFGFGLWDAKGPSYAGGFAERRDFGVEESGCSKERIVSSFAVIGLLISWIYPWECSRKDKFTLLKNELIGFLV